MKMDSSQAIAYFEKIYDALNIRFFDGELRKPIVTLTGKEYSNHVANNEDESLSGKKSVFNLEISIKCLNKPIEEIVTDIMHEMVHEYCAENGMKCSGSYHNRIFKTVAENHGLIQSVSKTSSGKNTYGWGKSKPSDDLLKFIDLQGWEAVDVTGIRFTRKRSEKQSRRTWLCPKCGAKYASYSDNRIPCCSYCNPTVDKCVRVNEAL